jgi:hypothetical protein
MHMQHRVGLITVAICLIVVAILLPFGVASVVSDVISPQGNHVYTLTPPAKPAPVTTLLNLNVISIDEWQRLATVRVSGEHVCNAACPFTERILFVSIPPAQQTGQGMPPNQTVDFPNASQVVTKDVQLPITGDPERYPFDAYRLNVATIEQHVFPDGHIDSLEGDAALGTLFLTLHMEAPRMAISRPSAINLDSLPDEGNLYNWVSPTR